MGNLFLFGALITIRFREKKGRACDTVGYMLEKALRIS